MYVRIILLELQRIASHLLSIGTMCNDLGQMFTGFMWSFKDRDIVLELLEEATGSRMFYVNMRLGGLVRDLPPDFEEHASEKLEYLEKRVNDYENFLEKNIVFNERMKGIGVLNSELAKELGVTGPVLRASGIEYDVRRNNPYYVYNKLHFSMRISSNGDNYARYKVRMFEMKESIRLIREALKNMPEGDAIGMPIKLRTPEPKNKIVTVNRELPRGECMMYMVTDSQKPYRLSIRSPSFINLAALKHIANGQRLADLFAILGSLDLVAGCVDR